MTRSVRCRTLMQPSLRLSWRSVGSINIPSPALLRVRFSESCQTPCDDIANEKRVLPTALRGWSTLRSPALVRVVLARIRPRRQASNRSEEHTSELQSPCNLVCRLLLEKKNSMYVNNHSVYTASSVQSV